MNIPVQNCSSCAACANACARNAITMQLDSDGFYRPVIDPEKCIECGMCERICPWTKSVDNPNGAAIEPKTVAAYAKDENIRMQSSSGGIFSVLAERFIDDGGVVVGVAQVTPTHFGHVVVDSKIDLEKLRDSKYVQADVGLVYREVRSLLKSGRNVLFSGTPCQVAGLYAMLGNVAACANLFTVDIVCHGVPSVKVYEKYVSEMEKKHHASLNGLVFRDKSTGWKGYSLLHRFESGQGVYEHHACSKYMRLFLSRICQNNSCEDCRYRKQPRIADITLGDYWGVWSRHPEMYDDKGTSVVLLNSIHGKELFERVADKVVQCDSKIEYAIAGNPCIVRSSKMHPKRAEFFADLEKYSLDDLIKKYCPFPSPMKKLYKQLRSLLGQAKRKIIALKKG